MADHATRADIVFAHKVQRAKRYRYSEAARRIDQAEQEAEILEMAQRLERGFVVHM